MFKINALIALSILGLSACGGSGSRFVDSAVVLDGVFKDSNVAGLSYESGVHKGKTNAAGKFRYEEGEDVSFSLGKIEFGSGLGKPVMTPVDLVENGKLTDTAVVNRVRLLMMLDKDNTPGNGIEISQKVQDKANDWDAVDFTATNFLNEVNTIQIDATAEDGVAHALPDADAAIAHLKTSLLCTYAGAYVGGYTGSESGNIAFMVDPVSANVKGSSFNPENEVSVDVNNIAVIDYDNELEFESGEDSAKKFSGKLSSTDKMQGSWANVSDEALTGDFTADRIGGANNAVYRYAVSFSGSDKGLYTFDVASDNKVTGTSYSVSSKEQSTLTGTLTDNTLTVTVADGTEINGIVDETTLTLGGVWSNVSDLTAGNFTGSGCKLN